MQAATSPAHVHIRVPDELALSQFQEQETSSSNNNEAVIQCQDAIANGVNDHSVSSVAPATVDPVEKTIVPFVPSKLHGAARWALETADFYGEKLAFFFGITSPKYSYEIKQYQKMAQEEASERLSANDESGWNKSHTSTVTLSSGLGASISSVDEGKY